MSRRGVDFTQVDNMFTRIDDFHAAQKLSDAFAPQKLHAFLDRCAQLCCPVTEQLRASYHWSIMQAEYATDILFTSKDKLAPLYEYVSRTAAVAVKAQNIATFLGRKLHGNYQDEAGNHFNTRIEGTRIRHCMGPASIKAYDKFGIALRIETTTNDVSFFKHYRDVEHKDGTITNKIASMRKSIYSISDLAAVMGAANMRYLHYLSSLDEPTDGANKLAGLSKTVRQHNHPYKGLNFFDEKDLDLLRVIARGEFTISGFCNKQIRSTLTHMSSSQVSRCIKRLRIHGIVRKIRGAYRYRLTKLGTHVVSLGLQLREFFIVPNLALCK
jgi:hypothetical protein